MNLTKMRFITEAKSKVAYAYTKELKSINFTVQYEYLYFKYYTGIFKNHTKIKVYSIHGLIP